MGPPRPLCASNRTDPTSAALAPKPRRAAALSNIHPIGFVGLDSASSKPTGTIATYGKSQKALIAPPPARKSAGEVIGER